MNAAREPAPLARGMGLWGVLFLTLSAATPASSVFVIVPDVVREAGTGAAMSLLLAGAVAFLVAHLYAELGSAFPSAGGEYVMVGRTLGPGAGFVVLVLNLLNSALTAAVLALGVSDYLGAVVPQIPAIPVALAAVAGSTALGLLNLRTNAWTTGVFLLVELAAIVLLAGLGAAHPARPLAALFVHPVKLEAGVLAPTGVAAVGLSATVALFAYDGYGSAVYFAEEMRDVRRRLGRAVLVALAVTVAAELAAVIAMLVGAPDLKSLFAAPNAAAAFAAVRGGPVLSRALSLGVALAILNAVIALVLLTARQLYSTGRDGVWPATVSQALTRVHPRLESPWAATLAAGALSAALCLVDPHILLILTGASITVIYAALALALLAGRRNGTTREAQHRAPGHPVLSLAALVALAAVLVSDAADPAEGRPSLIVTAATAAVAALYYTLVLRPRGWRPQPPIEEA